MLWHLVAFLPELCLLMFLLGTVLTPCSPSCCLCVPLTAAAAPLQTGCAPAAATCATAPATASSASGRRPARCTAASRPAVSSGKGSACLPASPPACSCLACPSLPASISVQAAEQYSHTFTSYALVRTAPALSPPAPTPSPPCCLLPCPCRLHVCGPLPGAEQGWGAGGQAGGPGLRHVPP